MADTKTFKEKLATNFAGYDEKEFDELFREMREEDDETASRTKSVDSTSLTSSQIATLIDKSNPVMLKWFGSHPELEQQAKLTAPELVKWLESHPDVASQFKTLWDTLEAWYKESKTVLDDVMKERTAFLQWLSEKNPDEYTTIIKLRMLFFIWLKKHPESMWRYLFVQTKVVEWLRENEKIFHEVTDFLPQIYQWAENHPEIIKKIVLYRMVVTKWINENPATVKRIYEFFKRVYDLFRDYPKFAKRMAGYILEAGEWLHGHEDVKDKLLEATKTIFFDRLKEIPGATEKYEALRESIKELVGADEKLFNDLKKLFVFALISKLEAYADSK